MSSTTSFPPSPPTSSPTSSTSPQQRSPLVRCQPVNAAAVTSTDCDRHMDAAVLIGLAYLTLRQGLSVPTAILTPLERQAALGDATCRLVASWVAQRQASTLEEETGFAVADPVSPENGDGVPTAGSASAARTRRDRMLMKEPRPAGSAALRPRGRSRPRHGQPPSRHPPQEEC